MEHGRHAEQQCQYRSDQHSVGESKGLAGYLLELKRPVHAPRGCCRGAENSRRHSISRLRGCSG